MERKWWTLLGVCVATFMLLVDVTIVNVALPSIQRDLGAGLTSLQWVVDAYALMLSALMLTAGYPAVRRTRCSSSAAEVGSSRIARAGSASSWSCTRSCRRTPGSQPCQPTAPKRGPVAVFIAAPGGS